MTAFWLGVVMWVLTVVLYTPSMYTLNEPRVEPLSDTNWIRLPVNL
jgi:hypothetical protein